MKLKSTSEMKAKLERTKEQNRHNDESLKRKKEGKKEHFLKKKGMRKNSKQNYKYWRYAKKNLIYKW